MDSTGSNGWSHDDHTPLSKWQLSSDILIAFAYFSIPLELVYFIYGSQAFPFRWVIAQFGLFIVLCGTTHLLTLWNYISNTKSSHICMTIAKVTTAIISCGTTVVLLRVIPELLDVKKREVFLTAKLMGGKIRLESEGLGKGSTCKFFVSLGVVTDLESETLISPKKLQQGSDLLGLKVLVVDDNAINRIVTHRLMETIGCKTTVTDSGQKCLEILMIAGPGAYQILLLDLSMPEMDGFTATIEILKRFKTGERPLIIALTANSDAHTRQRCFDVGMEGVLTKPISLEMIKMELSALLENFNDN